MTRFSRIAAAGFATAFVALSLACFDDGSRTVLGERAADGGACPAGETCSKEIVGLLFTGQMLYDEGTDRLGPVLVGGRFDLTFRPVGGVPMEDFAVAFEGEALKGEPIPLGVELRGTQPGRTTVRILDPDTGDLYDRLTLETVAIEGVELHNVMEEDRPVLYAGCEEMVGMRLLAKGGRLRAFDQDARVIVPEEVTPDPFVWDCFRYQVPVDQDEVVFEVEAGGEVWEETVPVEPLPPGASCPQLSD